MIEPPSQLIFLPGALGRTEFWRPAASLLTHPAQQAHMAWPGFSGMPPDPAIRNLDDLAGRVVARIDRPTALIAQSMGGVVALLAALLLWGDADPISSVQAGERLAAVLPNAALHVIPGGGHDLASVHAGLVAPLIDHHLNAT
jgi:pimeloyl-ACP methyl ester carboxylesterase